ncbi:glycosyltransferase family 2 protein [Sulfurimonas sp.]
MDITVVIPTYNRYNLLKRALDSVFSQTHQPQEVIVIDDGSNDDTYKIKEDFPQIIYIFQKNKGVSATRNRAILEAKYEWIAFLDDDDEWHESKLEKQMYFHQKHPNILMSYTAEKWVRNDIVVKIPKKYKKIGQDAFVENLSYCNIAPSSVIVHKSILNATGLFDEELEVCEDYDLWLRIASKYTIGLLNEKLIVKYAGHENQLGFSKNMDSIRIEILQRLMNINIDPIRKKYIYKELEEKKFSKLKVKKAHNSKNEF